MDILSTILDLHLTDDDEFGSQNGLNIAVAFTAYDNETEWSLDPTVGELVFNSFSWGPVEESPGVRTRSIEGAASISRDDPPACSLYSTSTTFAAGLCFPLPPLTV